MASSILNSGLSIAVMIGAVASVCNAQQNEASFGLHDTTLFRSGEPCRISAPPFNIGMTTITDDGRIGLNIRDPKDMLHISDEIVNDEFVYPALRISTVSTNALAQMAIARLPGEFSNFARPNDLVLRASYVAIGPRRSDVIITARNPDGEIRFGTVHDSTSLTSDVQRMHIQNNGRVGIGIHHSVAAEADLHLYSTNWLTDFRIQSSGLKSSTMTPTSRISFWSGSLMSPHQSTQFSPAIIQSVDDGDFTGALEFYTNGSGTSEKFGDPSTGIMRQAMRIVNGSVGIGNVNPHDVRLLVKGSDNSRDAALNVVSGESRDLLYVGNDGFVGIGITELQQECAGLADVRLAVDGVIVASDVRVRADCFPDYVFDPAYKLMSLDSLESFITSQRRLPGMPTETQVVGGTIDVGALSTTLVEKVEELTLYLMELRRENTALRARLEVVEKQVLR